VWEDHEKDREEKKSRIKTSKGWIMNDITGTFFFANSPLNKM
jgi:hypothetical protein